MVTSWVVRTVVVPVAGSVATPRWTETPDSNSTTYGRTQVVTKSAPAPMVIVTPVSLSSQVARVSFGCVPVVRLEQTTKELAATTCCGRVQVFTPAGNVDVVRISPPAAGVWTDLSAAASTVEGASHPHDTRPITRAMSGRFFSITALEKSNGGATSRPP